jgi:ABC-type Fe3+ transport system permease subunit
MPNYLLSCSCGQQTGVSSVQAGETVRCACGLPLQVPSMRELRTLPPAKDELAGKARRAVTWEDRHRVAFLLVLVAIAALAGAGYLAAQLPPTERPVTPQDVDEWVKTSTPDEALGMFEDLKQGLRPNSVDSAIAQRFRTTLLWGMGIALSVCIVALVGAAVALRPRGPKTIARH